MKGRFPGKISAAFSVAPTTRLFTFLLLRASGIALPHPSASGTRRGVKIKQRPEDFVVREGYRFEDDPGGEVWVYRMDKQKVSTLQALERLSKEFGVRRRNLSVCGLKDTQGRTQQLVGVFGGA